MASSALFICDALGAMDDDALDNAVDVLGAALKGLSNDVQVARRTLVPLPRT